jgi:hypothetical protein
MAQGLVGVHMHLIAMIVWHRLVVGDVHTISNKSVGFSVDDNMNDVCISLLEVHLASDKVLLR